MKLLIYIREHEYYLNGDYDFAFTVFHDPEIADRLDKGYIFVGEVEVDEPDITDITQAAVTAIDEEITGTRARLQHSIDGLEARKANLLAITHQP
ncbi:MAG: hypothetical protein DRR06_18525 [Gammaproteobacteria bacterium]|nr:MAG: hypothetical protein DRR06_18525 [Gammaproteobacteria bacterium]